MSANWKQVFDARPTTSFQPNDVFYLARSPYGATDDYGFTYSSLVPVNTKGDIFCWSTVAAKLGIGASNGMILQVDSTQPTGLKWSTATYPVSTTINRLLYSSANNVVGQVTSANSAMLVTSNAGVPAMSSTMTNGQLIIGSTGATPSAANLTAGTNIQITNAAASITIAVTGLAAFSWNNVTGSTQAMVKNQGYVVNNPLGLTTLTLPATAAFGDIIKVIGISANGWKLAQGAGQYIKIGESTSTVGVTGYIASITASDAVNLVCIEENLGWTLENGSQGSIGFA